MISDRQRQEAEEALEACQRGDCKYPDPSKPPIDNLRVEVPPLCMGFHATIYLEAGEQVMRYRKCPRHERWWAAEQARIRARRAAELARLKGKDPGTFPGGDR